MPDISANTPALSPEAKENEVCALAVAEAERRIRAGTASSQIIAHYLKLAATREKLENERLRAQIKLLEVKADSIEAADNRDQLYKEAIAAMKRYGGSDE